jgi:hypothetical protein
MLTAALKKAAAEAAAIPGARLAMAGPGARWAMARPGALGAPMVNPVWAALPSRAASTAVGPSAAGATEEEIPPSGKVFIPSAKQKHTVTLARGRALNAYVMSRYTLMEAARYMAGILRDLGFRGKLLRLFPPHIQAKILFKKLVGDHLIELQEIARAMLILKRCRSLSPLDFFLILQFGNLPSRNGAFVPSRFNAIKELFRYLFGLDLSDDEVRDLLRRRITTVESLEVTVDDIYKDIVTEVLKNPDRFWFMTQNPDPERNREDSIITRIRRIRPGTFEYTQENSERIQFTVQNRSGELILRGSNGEILSEEITRAIFTAPSNIRSNMSLLRQILEPIVRANGFLYEGLPVLAGDQIDSLVNFLIREGYTDAAAYVASEAEFPAAYASNTDASDSTTGGANNNSNNSNSNTTTTMKHVYYPDTTDIELPEITIEDVNKAFQISRLLYPDEPASEPLMRGEFNELLSPRAATAEPQLRGGKSKKYKKTRKSSRLRKRRQTKRR